ncbi:hypothetical protein RHSIM_Rhsim09G0125300 [Rhododendron simsii]|uniref:Uncharacterized protein n=1 Tax=Rhododendron simsii TaxID=118357 RepID=A0A834LDF1_RHOSS|nr:hypothetical protein RHSIM_Rhsim09G0125300 [Rhododendron simsii]
MTTDDNCHTQPNPPPTSTTANDSDEEDAFRTADHHHRRAPTSFEPHSLVSISNADEGPDRRRRSHTATKDIMKLTHGVICAIFILVAAFWLLVTLRYYFGTHIFPDVLLNDIAGLDGNSLLLSLKLSVNVLLTTSRAIIAVCGNETLYHNSTSNGATFCAITVRDTIEELPKEMERLAKER